jgi:hypothetical protein
MACAREAGSRVTSLSRKFKRAEAQLAVASAMRDNRPLTELVESTGYSYRQLLRFAGEGMEKINNDIEQAKDDQLTRIEEKWDEIEADASMTGAEKHLAWSRWMKLEMDLRGTAAPAKSLVGHVHDAENLGPYRKFVLAVRGLDESQIEELLTAARAVPRKIRPMPQPPKTSPLWKNQLGDGHVSS